MWWVKHSVGAADQKITCFDFLQTVILSRWSYEVKPNESQAILASNFLDHVIKGLTNDRNDFFKYNLDLIKPIVENWKKFITVPYDIIYERLNCDRTNRQIEVGIHVTAIFLVRCK